MINNEDKYKNVIEELKQLTITYDKFIIKNHYDLKNPQHIIAGIRKDDVILSWCFTTDDKSAWLALNNIKGKD